VALLSAGFFTPGYAPRGDRIAEVIEETSRLPREDVEAIADYVLGLPARPPANMGDAARRAGRGGSARHDLGRLHQSWWEMDYDAAEPHRTFSTANEAHIPVGRPVKLKFTSAEPVNSFCVPGLLENHAVAAGRKAEFRMIAERPGIYRAQSGCGRDQTTLLLVVQPSEQFELWRARQIADAPLPQDAERARGLKVFLTSSCVLCHTVRGTSAGARSGPDLTHFARRHYLAAGMLPRSSATLAAWISDPEKIKPGTFMPATKLADDELRALVSYVNGLK
jgi:cytochrome c oxidase subunit 2